jgi:hypothetical protein
MSQVLQVGLERKARQVPPVQLVLLPRSRVLQVQSVRPELLGRLEQQVQLERQVLLVQRVQLEQRVQQVHKELADLQEQQVQLEQSVQQERQVGLVHKEFKV